jgi:hypothetical protein
MAPTLRPRNGARKITVCPSNSLATKTIAKKKKIIISRLLIF